MQITKDTVDDWLGNFSAFEIAFCKRIEEYAQSANMNCQFHLEELERGHTQWVGDCEYFRTHKFPHDVPQLSFVKIFSLLMSCISSVAYFKKLEHRLFVNPSTSAIDIMREDIMGAPEIVAVVDFSIDCLDCLETHRIDKNGVPFVDRLTPDFRHDLIHFLKVENENKGGVILAMKGLYARPV